VEVIEGKADGAKTERHANQYELEGEWEQGDRAKRVLEIFFAI
jgi:hypothetical protein